MGATSLATLLDAASVRGVRPTTGFAMAGHEIPYDHPETIYERNGVTISCFPAIHGLSGAVGYTVAYAGLKVVFSGDTRPCKHVVEAAAGADLLIHECFQSPAVFAQATGLPLETALHITRLAHTIPEQMGKILDLTRPRMGALWHLDLTPGVDTVFDEISASYRGAVTATQDLTIFNVTRDAVTARQAKVNDAAPPVHGPSQTSPGLDPQPAPPAWWTEHSSTSDLHPLTGRAGRRSAAPTARVGRTQIAPFGRSTGGRAGYRVPALRRIRCVGRTGGW